MKNLLIFKRSRGWMSTAPSGSNVSSDKPRTTRIAEQRTVTVILASRSTRTSWSAGGGGAHAHRRLEGGHRRRQGGRAALGHAGRPGERGYLVGGKAASGSSADANAAAERALPGEVVRTATLDRGSEFAVAPELQNALGAPVYFHLPRHPWQRGTNENTNVPFREYLPKGTDLSAVSDEEVRSRMP